MLNPWDGPSLKTIICVWLKEYQMFRLWNQRLVYSCVKNRNHIVSFLSCHFFHTCSVGRKIVILSLGALLQKYSRGKQTKINKQKALAIISLNSCIVSTKSPNVASDAGKRQLNSRQGQQPSRTHTSGTSSHLQALGSWAFCSLTGEAGEALSLVPFPQDCCTEMEVDFTRAYLLPKIPKAECSFT